MKKSNTYNVVMTSIMAAFVLISTFLGVVIPVGNSSTTFHLGNTTCLLSGIILGPFYGGLSAAIGSALFDILNPIYVSSLPFTFIFKFIMAFVCGYIARRNRKKGRDHFYDIVGAVVGSLIYIVLGAMKALIVNLYFLKMEFLTALLFTLNGALISLIKTVFTIIFLSVLLPFLKEKLEKNNL